MTQIIRPKKDYYDTNPNIHLKPFSWYSILHRIKNTCSGIYLAAVVMQRHEKFNEIYSQ